MAIDSVTGGVIGDGRTAAVSGDPKRAALGGDSLEDLGHLLKIAPVEAFQHVREAPVVVVDESSQVTHLPAPAVARNSASTGCMSWPVPRGLEGLLREP